MTNSNLTPEQLADESEIKAILDKTTYIISNAQHDDLSRLAALYGSLHVLLEAFDSEVPVSNISSLLDHLNESFFEYIETLKPVPI